MFRVVTAALLLFALAGCDGKWLPPTKVEVPTHTVELAKVKHFAPAVLPCIPAGKVVGFSADGVESFVFPLGMGAKDSVDNASANLFSTPLTEGYYDVWPEGSDFQVIASVYSIQFTGPDNLSGLTAYAEYNSHTATATPFDLKEIVWQGEPLTFALDADGRFVTNQVFVKNGARLVAAEVIKTTNGFELNALHLTLPAGGGDFKVSHVEVGCP